MKTVILIFFIISPFIINCQSTKRVLFLGNSYTFVNDLPQLLANFSAAAGDSLIFDYNTPGGYTLQQHTTDQGTLNKIALGNWDFVVLQEQSQMPSFPIYQVVTDVFPFAKRLDSLIKIANACTQTIFFMTWGRKNGDASNCSSWPPVCSYNGMDSLLNLRYKMMADSNDAFVAPVGATWHYLRDNNPSLELYDTDESHPSTAGSYAAAATFYSIIFQKNPILVNYNYSLSATNAQIIRNAAKSIAFDSLSKWNVGKYLPQANFTYNNLNDTVYFNNTSTYANEYRWDFGDGDTSSVYSPMHIYLGNNLYKVKLISKKCEFLDSILIDVDLTANEIGKKSESNIIRLIPNPSNEFFTIKAEKEIVNQTFTVKLFDIFGREVESHEYYQLGNVINIKSLKKGNYIVLIKNKSALYYQRLTKM